MAQGTHAATGGKDVNVRGWVHPCIYCKVQEETVQHWRSSSACLFVCLSQHTKGFVMGGCRCRCWGDKYPRGAVAKALEVGPNATSTPAQGAACWARISTFRAGQLLLVLFRASLELQQPNSASDSLPVSSVMWLGQHRPSQRASFFMIPGHPSACHVEMAHNWTWSTSGQLQRGEIPTRGLAGHPASAEAKRRAYHSSIPPVLLCLPDPWVLIRISSCSQMQKVRESFLQGHSYHRSYKWLQWHQLLSLTVLLCQARQR